MAVITSSFAGGPTHPHRKSASALVNQAFLDSNGAVRPRADIIASLNAVLSKAEFTKVSFVWSVV
jgi:hypothetical protein